MKGIEKLKTSTRAKEPDSLNVQTHNVASNTSKMALIARVTHATAIHNDSRVGKITTFEVGLPVALNASLFKCEANRFQKTTIVDLCFAGDAWRLGKSGSGIL